MEEIWKDIPGWEWRYQVSSLGNVMRMSNNYTLVRKTRSWNKTGKVITDIRKTKAWPMPVCKKRNKYLSVHFSIWNQKSKMYLINRLVAAAFHWLDLNDPKQLACHKDDDPHNNREDNIFVGSQSDNMRDMESKGRRVNSLKRARKLTEEEINFVKESKGKCSDVWKKFWVSAATISRIRSGKQYFY